MKPFAYISKDGVLFKELPPSPWFELTPLYAMHELTDEEILLVSKTVPIDADTYDLQEFARAILKKASEK